MSPSLPHAIRIFIRAIAIALLLPLAAQALPSQPVVSAGSVSFLSNETGLDVTTQDFRNIINWADFSIGSSTETSFIQPGLGDSVLNRVTGNQPTVISGNVTSNGGLVIINPAGIYLAPGASIHASFLTLSTRNLSDADFLAGLGNYEKGNGGSITISGAIDIASGGNLNVISGSNITLDGFVSAPGNIAITGGSDVTFSGSINLSSGGNLNVTSPSQTVISSNASFTGVGTIAISGGQLVLLQNPGDISVIDTPTISMVPEPGEYALILAGLALLAIWTKRRPGIY